MISSCCNRGAGIDFLRPTNALGDVAAMIYGGVFREPIMRVVVDLDGKVPALIADLGIL